MLTPPPLLQASSWSLVGKPLHRLISVSLLYFTLTTTAQAVSIASLDFGVDPSVAASSSRVEAGFDFVNSDDIPEDDSGIRHGTALVQDLLSLSSGSHIIPLKVTGPGVGWDLARGDAALNLILQSPDVKVIDFSSLQPINPGQLRRAVNQGRVVVVDAGNGAQGSPSNQARTIPQLGGGGIIVGGVDANDQIHPISNRAGDLAEHYLVAPASSQNTPTQSTTFSRVKVSAASARLLEAAPNLRPDQVVKILFNTAVDLGAAGIDPIYGNGLLNVDRALSPQGLTSIGGDDTSTASSGGGSGGGALGALVVAGAVGYALTRRSTTLKKTLVLDQYERPYVLDLTQRAPKLGTLGNPMLLGFHPVQTGQPPFSVMSQTQSGHQQNLMVGGTDQSALAGRILNLDEDAGFDGQLLWQSTHFDGSDQVFALNQPIPQYFGATSPATSKLSLTSNPFSTPYLGFAQHGVSMKLGQHFDTQNGSLKTQFGLASKNDQGRHGSQSNGILFGGVVENDHSAYGIQVGYTVEEGALFGSASNGPLAVAGAETVSLSLSGQYQLSQNITVLGGYSHGSTAVKAASGSLLTGFSTLSSQTIALGVIADSVWIPRDQLSFIISQPLSITDGQVNIHTPTDRTHNQQLLFEDETVDLGFSNAPETRYELVYNRALANGLKWQSRLLYRDGSFVSDASSFGLSTMLSWGF